MAGVSVEYLARLEQGRAAHPSSSVLSSLATALRLSDQERGHLFRVADQQEPSPGQIRRDITSGVQRVLDRLGTTPVIVVDTSWRCISANPLAHALAADEQEDPTRAQNLARAVFTGAPTRYLRTPEEERLLRLEVVSDLREARGRHPHDAYLAGLVEELVEVSVDFAELWARRPAAPQPAATRTFAQPTLGPITLDSDTLTVRDSDLRLIVHTAAPGSPAAQRLTALSAAVATSSA